MEDKEKQIEEMAKYIRPVLTNRVDIGYIPDLDKPIAEELIKQDYCIIPKGSVVLSKEEFERLTAPRVFINPRQLNSEELAEKLKDFNYGIIGVDKSSIEIIQTRAEMEKETAEKILDKVDYESNGQTKQITDLLRKQFGLEVEV